MSAVSSESHEPAGEPGQPAAPEPPAGQADFGANEWLVEELYQRYLSDPGSVDRAWWSFFADYQPSLPNGTGPQPVVNLKPAPAPTAPAPAPAPAPPPAAAPPVQQAAAPAAPARPAPPAPAPGPAAPPPSASASASGGHGGQQAARGGGPHRQQHDGQPGRAHRDQRPRDPGQAARGQQDRHQQPPAPRPRRQGVVHPPDRVRGGQGASGAAGDEPRLRRRERQAGHRPAGPRQPGPGHRRAHQRRRQATARAEPQDGGGDGLPPVLDDLRGHRAPGALGQARGRRLPGHHRDDHQPRHDRHRALGAAADGRPGLHRGRGRDGVPGRLRRGVRGDTGPAGDQQVGHAHLDL